MELEMRRKVSLYGNEKRAWHFIILEKGVSCDLKKFFTGMEGGFGSLPVEVTIGKTVWRASIFPENKDGAFMLPLKAEVRNKEDIKAGDVVTFNLKILI